MKKFAHRSNTANMAIAALRKFYGVRVGESITSVFTDCGPPMISNCPANAKVKNGLTAMVKTPAIRNRQRMWIISGVTTLSKRNWTMAARYGS